MRQMDANKTQEEPGGIEPAQVPTSKGKQAHAMHPEQPATPDAPCCLTQLPVELIASILSYLGPVDLARVSSTCRTLYAHATEDRLWRAHVQANVPCQTVTSSSPCPSFRQLYRAHDPRWFLPRYKIWFGDSTYLGSLILVRYDQHRGCIEGYLLLANNRSTDPPFAVDNLWVSPFEPDIHLHLDQPSFRLPANPHHDHPRVHGRPVLTLKRRRDEDGAGSGQPVWEREDPPPPSPTDPVVMDLGSWSYIKTTFRLARCLPRQQEENRDRRPPSSPDAVWPSPSIPSSHRVLATAMSTHTTLGPRHCPASRRDICDRAFRIARGAFHFRPVALFESLPEEPAVGARTQFCEEVTTYATLDPALYTPTRRRPLRGIWVGDYGVHGCEFLLLHQPDDDDDADDDNDNHDAADADEDDDDEGEEAEASKSEPKPEAAGEGDGLEGDHATASDPSSPTKTQKNPAKHKRSQYPVFRGRLEAIKLTGDSNVPRGQASFVVDDLGEGGFVGVADEGPFAGARRVKSKGHIARAGFTSDEYIDGELVILSTDLLAHKWFQLRHVSYFRRVDIDKFLVPS
ncbi:hypothetical protein VTJ83DRAFT_3254 [Remersonia thermophila]|uniref:F-box domain-containing protein n=1 Tax=Remersonia thermophila TaxID=72144 RepID=A0ABR4DDH9_9PEZI